MRVRGSRRDRCFTALLLTVSSELLGIERSLPRARIGSSPKNSASTSGCRKPRRLLKRDDLGAANIVFQGRFGPLDRGSVPRSRSVAMVPLPAPCAARARWKKTPQLRDRSASIDPVTPKLTVSVAG